MLIAVLLNHVAVVVAVAVVIVVIFYCLVVMIFFMKDVEFHPSVHSVSLIDVTSTCPLLLFFCLFCCWWVYPTSENGSE